jgi:paired small multidrug resistance pump
MGWLLVLVAALSEVMGVIGLTQYSQEKKLGTGVLYVLGFGASFAFLYASFNYLQVSVAYAVWIGIGTAGAVLINMIFFGESKSAGRLVSLLFIVVGVVGLKAIS